MINISGQAGTRKEQATTNVAGRELFLLEIHLFKRIKWKTSYFNREVMKTQDNPVRLHPVTAIMNKINIL